MFIIVLALLTFYIIIINISTHLFSTVDSWVGKIPSRWKWQPTPVFLPRESHQEEPCRLQSIRSKRVGHGWSNLACTHIIRKTDLPDQRSNLGLPHCRQILYHLSHQRSSLRGRNQDKRRIGERVQASNMCIQSAVAPYTPSRVPDKGDSRCTNSTCQVRAP